MILTGVWMFRTPGFRLWLLNLILILSWIKPNQEQYQSLGLTLLNSQSSCKIVIHYLMVSILCRILTAFWRSSAGILRSYEVLCYMVLSDDYCLLVSSIYLVWIEYLDLENIQTLIEYEFSELNIFRICFIQPFSRQDKSTVLDYTYIFSHYLTCKEGYWDVGCQQNNET